MIRRAAYVILFLFLFFLILLITFYILMHDIFFSFHTNLIIKNLIRYIIPTICVFPPIHSLFFYFFQLFFFFHENVFRYET